MHIPMAWWVVASPPLQTYCMCSCLGYSANSFEGILLRFILTIAFMVFAVQASALPLDKIKAMVNLVDQAKGGCWTNLRETREYAEEKLRMKGIAYVLPMDTYASDEYPEFHIQNFFLTITVTA